ncbi:MAG: hypothetical protein KGI25_08810 [Thaumarchaeota archaeon]|nr:hypothetical protein [Nitrososphaerota archaeon]
MSSVYATSYANIHLDIVGGVLVEDSSVAFSGKLTAPDGTPISNRTVFIEDDAQYTRPDIIIALAKTDSDGKFYASWKAVPKDNGAPFHLYAEFFGGKQFGFTRSETYESVIKLNNQTTHEVVPSKTVPSWFLYASKLWHDGKMRDLDYAYGVENMVDYQIIKSNNTSDFTTIPFWIRYDAGLLSDGKISTDEYTEMLGYLINNGIIK